MCRLYTMTFFESIVSNETITDTDMMDFDVRDNDRMAK